MSVALIALYCMPITERKNKTFTSILLRVEPFDHMFPRIFAIGSSFLFTTSEFFLNEFL